MNRHLNEIGDIAFRILFMASVIIVLWLACRIVWGEESKAACPALESPHSRLMDALAQRHAEYMARNRRQGHDGFSNRADIIRGGLDGVREVAEICAESWPKQCDCTTAELWAEFVKCWRQSSGHWSVACRKHRFIGAAMAQGKNGVFYGCIIAGD